MKKGRLKNHLELTHQLYRERVRDHGRDLDRELAMTNLMGRA